MNNQQIVIETPGLSAHLAELTVVLNVFESVSDAFNIFTDSLYVAQSIPLLETCGTFNFNTPAGSLFSQLQNVILAEKTSVLYWSYMSSFWSSWTFSCRQ